MMEATVTVIIPAYNAERFLRRSVESVVAQTMTQWQLVIVDDASTDGTPRLADELAAADPRITVVHKPHNAGLAEARRTGIHAAAAPLVMHLDADDWLLPEAMAALHRRLTERGLDYCAGTHRMVQLHGATTLHAHAQVGEMDGDGFLRFTLATESLPSWGSISRKELWHDDILPPSAMSLPNEDLLLNVGLSRRMARAGVYNDLVVCCYDYNPQSLTARGTLYEAARWQQYFAFLRASLERMGRLDEFERQLRILAVDHAMFHLHHLDKDNEWVREVLACDVDDCPRKTRVCHFLLRHDLLRRAAVALHRRLKR